MTLNTFSAGVNTSFSSQLNANFNNAYPRVVASTPYTGTAFNATRSGASGTTTNNTTLTVAAGAVIDYIRIVCTVASSSQRAGGAGHSGQASLKMETSVASAASWTTRFDQVIASAPDTSSAYWDQGGVFTIEFYYAPTAGEKSGGLDIRFTGTAITTYSSGTANGSITNIQTMIYAN